MSVEILGSGWESIGKGEFPQTTTMIVCVAGWNLTDHNLNLSEYSLEAFVE
jgi:hypothetical protein